MWKRPLCGLQKHAYAVGGLGDKEYDPGWGSMKDARTMGRERERKERENGGGKRRRPSGRLE